MNYNNTNNKSKHELYSVWSMMKQRCYNKNSKSYKYYGALGIKVSDEWQSFDNFLKDMGERPSGGYSIERILLTGDYSKENCRWANKSEQSANRMFVKNKNGYKGVGKHKLGKTYYTVINFYGNHVRMSGFTTPEEAAYMYDQFMIQIFGDNIPLNFLGCNPMYK